MSLAAAAQAAADLRQVAAEAPLAVARLWDAPPPRTSQRRAAQHLGRLVTIVAGGNRSGKTQLGAMLAVASALGREDPAVLAWCRLNGFDPCALPAKPGDVWAVAPDHGDSREYVRPAIRRYLPRGCRWRNEEGPGYSEVVLPGGGRIGFKAVEEGRDGFQGTAKDGIWFDEEPRDEGVWNESLMRLADRRGRLWCTLTPLRGLTWMHARYVERVSPDVAVHELDSYDNPHVPHAFVAGILKHYGPHEREARRRGRWTALEGRVWAFQRSVHLVPSFVPPSGWKRIGAIDFGTRKPFCYLLLAIDPSDDIAHAVAEHYAAELTLAGHAKAIRAIEAVYGEPFVRAADPEDRGARLALAREHGIATVPARKERSAGISAVAERMEPDAEGRPHLLVHDRCTNLVRELENYRWADIDTGKRETTAGEDHACDALRYGCMAEQRSAFGVG